MLIGLFSDIHFQPKGLERIVATGEWMVEEFQRRGVHRIHSLGDVLNTREDVSVAAQSAATSFFEQLARRWPVEIVLGNHDMNLKHDRRVSSLDGLRLHPQIKIHREVAFSRAQDTDGSTLTSLMLPYHEDQSVILGILQNLRQKAPEVLKHVVGYGHLGINGAVQVTRYNTRFTGAVGPDAFGCLKRLFTGHFHVHQELPHRVVYLGSPLQFNFGDAGDRRGVVVYDTATDHYEHVLNPHCEAFHVINARDVEALTKDPAKYKGTFVTVIYDDVVTEDQHDRLAQQLGSVGVLEVRRESVVDQAIREHTVEVGAVARGVADLVEPFVASVLPASSDLDHRQVVGYGQAVIAAVNATHQDVADTGAVFEADLHSLSIAHFLGVREPVLVDFAAMADGIWFCEGKVGAGKSTILEAICWALFGDVIRSDMKADDVVNDISGKDCKVSVRFQNGWEVVRFRKCADGSGVKVFRDGTYQAQFEKGDPRATQRAINDLIGIDYDTFTKSIMLGQSLATNFISAGDKIRREILETMLGLERFDAYLEHVREEKRSLIAEADQQVNVQQLKAMELKRIADHIRELDLQILTARDHHQQQLNTLTQEITTAKQQLATQQVALASVTDQQRQILERSLAQVSEAQANLATFQGKLDAKARADALEAEARGIETGVLARLAEGRRSYEKELAFVDAEVIRLTSEGSSAAAAMQALPTIDINLATATTAEVHKLSQSIESWRVQVSVQQSQRDALLARIRAAKPELDRLEALAKTGAAGEHCPTCRQPLDAQGITTLATATRADLMKLAAEATALGTAIQQLQTQIADTSHRSTTLQSSLPTPDAVALRQHRIEQYQIQIQAGQSAQKQVDQARSALRGRWFTLMQPIHGDPTGLVDPDQAAQTHQDHVTELRRRSASFAATFDPTEYQRLLAEHTQRRSAHDQAVANARQVLTTHQAEIERCTEAITTKRATLTQMGAQDPVTALTAAKARQQGDWAGVEREIGVSKDHSVAIGRKQAVVGFWDRAFAAKGGMRAYLLEDSVTALNVVINGYMAALSQGQTLHFQSDLTVVERYAKRSGGQRKVTDISVLLGMREVVSQRSRFRAGFLFLDEIFDALDQEHRRAVQELLVTLATRVKKVLVITHADFTGISITGTLRAAMTPQGTRISIAAT